MTRLESGDTETARVVIRAIPSELLHVQLVWDHPSNDQDLHLVHVSGHCSSNLDCYFANCKLSYNNVQWFATHQPGIGPNRLDRDDTNGIGPENINIEEPMPGTYGPSFTTTLASVVALHQRRTLTNLPNGTLAFGKVEFSPLRNKFGQSQMQSGTQIQMVVLVTVKGRHPSPTPNQIGAVRDGSNRSGSVGTL